MFKLNFFASEPKGAPKRQHPIMRSRSDKCWNTGAFDFRIDYEFT